MLNAVKSVQPTDGRQTGTHTHTHTHTHTMAVVKLLNGVAYTVAIIVTPLVQLFL